MVNLLMEQYGIQKLKALRESPYACLVDSKIEQTPHQIEAFVAALQALKNGGIILADEVGLGKTIEAGLILKYLLSKGAKKILIAMPPPLRKQWQIELKEKFDIDAVIPDNKYAVSRRDKDDWDYKMHRQREPLVIITSYGMASWIISKYKTIRFDCFVFDEAHRLRNYPKAKMAKALFNATRYIPKVMLTATPIQNYLRDLYALAQFIDERLFVSEEVFDERYVKTEDYVGLKEVITPILHRTLRRDVAEYLEFTKRDCMAVDFKLTQEEAVLYQLANDYLRRPQLYAVNASNSGLVRMVIRKLLASSSYAVAETFEVLRERLLVLKQDTNVEKAETSLREFFSLIDDDGDDADGDYEEDNLEEIDRQKYRAEIDEELRAVENIIRIASTIKSNSKAKAVVEVLKLAFEDQKSKGYSEKAIIFTESKRTQKYLKETLINAGFDGIVTFNGELNDPEIKQIYNAWRGKHPKNMSNAPSVDLKQSIVDYFEHQAKILIATDIASEGLNLQFCDTVINYDLPWNPMKIEQRIGRCHRFGQKRDVWVYNLLNRENAADARVYEILEKKFQLFNGVFGASDDALGLLESGFSFEKRIMEIYQSCATQFQFKHEFDRLEREMSRKRDKKFNELKSLLNQSGGKQKKDSLHSIYIDLHRYADDLKFWSEVANDKVAVCNITYELPDGMLTFDKLEHGYIFAGIIAKTASEFLEPLLCVYDEDGEYCLLSEPEIIDKISNISDDSFKTFTPASVESKFFGEIFAKIGLHFAENYHKQHRKDIDLHKKKVENWIENKRGIYNATLQDKNRLLSLYKQQKAMSTLFQEKIDIQKNIDKLTKEIDKDSQNYHAYMSKIEIEAKEDIKKFTAQFEIEPLVIVNIIVKF